MPRTLPSIRSRPVQGTLPSALFLLTFGSAAAAQEPAAGSAAPVELACTFDQGSQRQSDDRSARRADGELRLTFTGIDAAGGVATIAGEDRSTGVAVISADHAISFLEIMPPGNVALTTVSLVDLGDDLPAVHSRHVFDSLRPGYLVTQLYGACVARL